MVFHVVVASSSSLAMSSASHGSSVSELETHSFIMQAKLTPETINNLILDAREFVQMAPIVQETICLESLGFSIEQINEIQSTLLDLERKGIDFSRFPEITNLYQELRYRYNAYQKIAIYGDKTNPEYFSTVTRYLESETLNRIKKEIIINSNTEDPSEEMLGKQLSQGAWKENIVQRTFGLMYFLKNMIYSSVNKKQYTESDETILSVKSLESNYFSDNLDENKGIQEKQTIIGALINVNVFPFTLSTSVGYKFHALSNGGMALLWGKASERTVKVYNDAFIPGNEQTLENIGVCPGTTSLTLSDSAPLSDNSIYFVWECADQVYGNKLSLVSMSSGSIRHLTSTNHGTLTIRTLIDGRFALSVADCVDISPPSAWPPYRHYSAYLRIFNQHGNSISNCQYASKTFQSTTFSSNLMQNSVISNPFHGHYSATTSPYGEHSATNLNSCVSSGLASGSMVILNSGIRVVAWESSRNIIYQAFYTNNVAVNAAEQLSIGWDISDIEMAPLATGGFTMVWKISFGQCYGQEFSESHAPIGGIFSLNAGISPCFLPKVVGLKNGGFAISFFSNYYLYMRTYLLPSPSPSPSPSQTPTSSRKPSLSSTMSRSVFASPSTTISRSSSVSPTLSSSGTISATSIPSQSVTPTSSVSKTITPSRSTSPSCTPSMTLPSSVTASPTPSYSNSVTSSPTSTMTQTPSVSISLSRIASITLSSTGTISITPTRSDGVIQLPTVSVLFRPSESTSNHDTVPTLFSFFATVSITPSLSHNTSSLPMANLSFSPSQSVSSAPLKDQEHDGAITDNIIFYIAVVAGITSMGFALCCICKKKHVKEQLKNGSKVLRKNSHYQSNSTSPQKVTVMSKSGHTVSWEYPPINETPSSKIFLGTWNNTRVAIKKYQYNSLNKRDQQTFENEAECMQKFNSEYLLTLHDVIMNAPHYCLVIEYMPGGSLFDVLGNSTLPWKQRWVFVMDITHGIRVLHDKDVIHRDIKSLNILVSDTGRAKVADFGQAKTHSMATARSKTGTVQWLPPELLDVEGDIKPNKQSDMYSYAVVLWEISTQEAPFSDISNTIQLESLIRQGQQEDITKVERAEEGESHPKLAPLIKHCWQTPSKRPSIERALRHLDGSHPLPRPEVNFPSDGPSRPSFFGSYQ